MTRAPQALLACAALLLLVLVAFYPTLWAFHERWSSTELGYSHGYPVLALSLYALYERRDKFFESIAEPRKLLLLALLGMSMAWFFANVIQVRIVQQLLLPLIPVAWLGAVFGWRTLRAVIIPIGLIYLAVPLWDFLTTPLRQVTVSVVQSLLEMGRLPALIDGYYITVPGGKFVVAGGCSGLNYVLTSLTLGVFYSLLYLKTLRRRMIFISVCITFSLLVNWARVFALVLIGLYSDMKSELVHDHETFGWVLFTIVLVPMFWIASRLEQADINEQADTGASEQSNPATADTGEEVAAPEPVQGTVEVESSPVAARNLVSRQHLVSALIATVIAIAGPLLALQLISNAGKNPKQFTVNVPSGWSARSLSDAEWRPHFSGYDREVHWRLRYGFRENTLSFYHYDIQGQERELVFWSNRIADPEETVASGIVFVPYGERQVNVREHEIDQGRNRYLVWSLYWVANRPVSDELSAKLYQLLAAAQGRMDAHLITLSAKCVGNNCAAVRKRFQRVMPNLLEGF